MKKLTFIIDLPDGAVSFFFIVPVFFIAALSFVSWPPFTIIDLVVYIAIAVGLGGNSIGFFDSLKLGDQAQSLVTSPLSLLRLSVPRRRRERGEVTQLWAWSPNFGLSKNPIELPPCFGKEPFRKSFTPPYLSLATATIIS